MNDTLMMVMRPRAIPECVESINALHGVDRVDLHGFTETQLETVIADVVAKCEHEFVILTGDDSIHSQEALDAVLVALRAGHPVVTGWCNLDSEDPRCNLTFAPLVHDIPKGMHSYPLRTINDVRWSLTPLVETTLAGFALTGMSRDLWQQFPFTVYEPKRGGWGSDYHLSYRLQQAGVPIVAPVAAEVHHVKEVVNHSDQAPEKALLVGQIMPCVSWHTEWPHMMATRQG